MFLLEYRKNPISSNTQTTIPKPNNIMTKSIDAENAPTRKDLFSYSHSLSFASSSPCSRRTYSRGSPENSIQECSNVL